MLQRPRAVLSAVLACICLAAGAQAAPAANFNVAQARKSVVFIRRITPGRETALGSGFLVSSDGLIYTSRHVIESTDRTAQGTLILVGVPSAADPDDLDWFKAAVAYRPDDDKLDFAILKIAANEGYPPFSALPLSLDKLELGADVAVIGYPYIRENEAVLSFNKGSISATRVHFSGRTYYQTDAAVNHGNSGGPLLNERGEAVGIITLKEVNAENIGFALYLKEASAAIAAAAPKIAALEVRPGPIQLSDLRLPTTIHPIAAAWHVDAGRPQEKKGELALDGHGGPYWVTSRQPLPADFQLVIPCALEYLQGSQAIDVSHKTSLRNLYVRFNTADTSSPIWERKGYQVQFGHKLLALFKNGKLIKTVSEGNEQAKPFRLSITKRQNRIQVAIDGRTLIDYRDPDPLTSNERFSIGGYLSKLHLGAVTAIQLDGPARSASQPQQASAVEK